MIKNASLRIFYPHSLLSISPLIALALVLILYNESILVKLTYHNLFGSYLLMEYIHQYKNHSTPFEDTLSKSDLKMCTCLCSLF